MQNIEAMLAQAGYTEDQPTAEVQEAAEVVEEIQEEAEQPAAEESEDEDGEGEEPEAKPEEEAPPEVKPWKKGPPETVPYEVLSKARAERREALEQLEAYRVEVERLRAGVPAQAPAAAPGQIPGLPPRPKAEDFATFDQYEEAKDAWLVNTARAQVIAESQQATAQHVEQTRLTQSIGQFQARLAEAQQANPDVAEIREYIAPAWGHLHPMIQQAIVEDDNPAAAMRGLAEMAPSLQELVHMVNSNPVRAVAMIGRASVAHAAPIAKQAPAPVAPQKPPVRTVQTQPVNTKKSVGDMSPAEIMKKYGSSLR